MKRSNPPEELEPEEPKQHEISSSLNTLAIALANQRQAAMTNMQKIIDDYEAAAQRVIDMAIAEVGLDSSKQYMLQTGPEGRLVLMDIPEPDEPKSD